MSYLNPDFEQARDRMIADSGPILGHQRAALGAERFARFVQGHGELTAMMLFLTMSVLTAQQAGYSDDFLDGLRNDASDVRRAADEWASACEQLADHWQAQRQETE